MSEETLHHTSQAFEFQDGSRIVALPELVYKLKLIDDVTFAAYVNGVKNDFSDWIEHGLRKPGLANLIRNIRSKTSMATIIEAYMTQDHHDAPAAVQPQAPQPAPQQPQPAPQPQAAPEQPPAQHPGDKVEINEEKNRIEIAPKGVEEDPYEPPSAEQDEEQLIEQETKERSVESAEIEPHPDAPHHEQLVTEAEAKRYADLVEQAKFEIHKVMKGQDNEIHEVFLTLICEAHALLEGVPGLAKSLLVETLSQVIAGTTFKRIQFMPDILPADVVGSQIYNPQKNEFVTIQGPIFANFVLADEINRAPPKTHSAIMEAMAEKKINIAKEEFILDRPFMVLATQNPLEQKGTYSLPEAVLDRFMFKIILDYPKREHEKMIIKDNATTNTSIKNKVNAVLTKEILLEMQKKAKQVYLSNRIKDYIMDIVEATRGLNKDIIGMKFVSYGGGPRATIYLGIAARAQALLSGRHYVLPEDVQRITPSILRHRLALNFKGKAHNISTDRIIEEILKKVSGL